MAAHPIGRVAIGFMIAIVMASAAWGQVSSVPTLAVAVLRDRTLQPVGSFDGRSWATAAPAQGWPRQWLRWSDEGRSESVRSAPRSPAPACAAPQTQLVEGTGDPRSSSSRGATTLATSIAVTVLPVRALPASSDVRLMAVTAIEPLFARRATENGIAPATLARVPVTIDAMYSSGTGVAEMYYFESSKRIPDAGQTPLEDPKGIVRLAVSGWLRRDGRQLRSIGTKAELNWDPADDRAAASSAAASAALRPIAVFRAGDAQMWMMRGPAVPRETYTLYAVRDTAIRRVLSVDVAAC